MADKSYHVVVQDKMPQFVDKNDLAVDKGLNNCAVDIIRMAKMDAPHLTGALSSSGRIIRKGVKNFWCSFGGGADGGGGPDVPYARRWEFETPKGGFKQGKKSHYLGDAADKFATPENLAKHMAANMLGLKLL